MKAMRYCWPSRSACALAVPRVGRGFNTGAALLVVLIAFLLTSLLSAAWGQPINPTDLLEPYRGPPADGDLATGVMRGILGATYDSPLALSGTATTLFGSIFVVFNVIVFAVGLVWGSYGVISGIVSTAHEGVVLGKRLNALWLPIRMVTGIGGLVPAFGGFSLSQVVMILATSWGISFGNFAYNEALNAAANFTTLTNPAFASGAPGKDPQVAAEALFEQRLCEIGIQANIDNYTASGAPIPPDKQQLVTPLQGPNEVGLVSGTASEPKLCGHIAVIRKGGGARSSSSLFGFRVAGVNYDAIADQTWAAYSGNFPIFAEGVKRLADDYERQRRAALSGTSQTPIAKPVEALRALATQYSAVVSQFSAPTEVKSAINASVLENMRRHGFLGAGSYYSVHAEVNAAVLQATNQVEIVAVNFNSGKAVPDGAVNSAGEFGVKPGTGLNDSAINSATRYGQGGLCKALGLNASTAVGNCSFGQKFVEWGIDLGTAGSGGRFNVVDPIIAMKNIGDYMLITGESVLVAAFVANTTSKAVGEVGKATGPLGSVVSAIASVAESLSSIGILLGGLLFAVGALCSLYIPLVPFITWVSAMVQQMCITVEAFAAAPLWALTHLQAEGEGMGQRTERGYIISLNLLFRPTLMVVAFFAASGLIILLGSVVLHLYMGAVASVQGNSLTGAVSIIGFIFIFFVIMNTLIQSLFNLTIDLPDDVIGWVGGVGRSQIGRDLENKVSALFVAGGRFGAQAATPKPNFGGGKGGGGGKPDATKSDLK